MQEVTIDEHFYQIPNVTSMVQISLTKVPKGKEMVERMCFKICINDLNDDQIKEVTDELSKFKNHEDDCLMKIERIETDVIVCFLFLSFFIIFIVSLKILKIESIV